MWVVSKWSRRYFNPIPRLPSPRLQGRGARWAETIHELEKRRVLPAQTQDLSHSVSAMSLPKALGRVDTDRREGFREGLAGGVAEVGFGLD